MINAAINRLTIRNTCAAILGVATVWISSQLAIAQCPHDWLPGEGAPGVVGSATVFASTVWDPDATGPQNPVVVFGGTMVGAGDLPVSAVAAWDPATDQWLALGDGLNYQVRALIVYNGQLIAAAGHNSFGNTGPGNGVARFDAASQTWQPLGSAGFQNVVWALAVYNGDVYAGGLFNSAGGTPVNNIARWNDAAQTWHPVGPGIPGGVTALTVFNGELLAASNGVLRWNPATSTWEPFGPNLTGNVKVFATYNGELVVGGSFQTVPGTPTDEVARWDAAATTWQPLGDGMNDNVNTLAQFNGELIAGGTFTSVSGQFAYRMARWDGAAWFPISPGPGMPVRRCDSLTVHDGVLYAGGARTQPSGLQAEQVGQWNGSQWSYLGVGIDAVVYDLESFNGDLIVGGWFSTAGDILANGIARRDDAGNWSTLGQTGVTGGDGYVSDLIVYNGSLLASGSFTAIDGLPVPGIAQWDGKAWSPFGNLWVGKKLIHDGQLYAVGDFGPNQRVARWSLATQTWQPLGPFPPNSGAWTLTIFNGDLVAGGIGSTASVWRWDLDAPSPSWQPIGQHLGFSSIQTMAVYNGELLAGGYNDGFGGPPGGLARFNAASNQWVPFAGGLFLGNEAPDEILAVFDLRIYNGELIVVGTFSFAGDQQYMPDTVEAWHVARWNGKDWSSFGAPGSIQSNTGTNDAATTLHEHNGNLIIGGWFDMANGAPNGHWARWGAVCPVGDVTQDGVVNIQDLLAVIAAWGSCPVPCPADIDSNGVVNIADLLAVISNWG